MVVDNRALHPRGFRAEINNKVASKQYRYCWLPFYSRYFFLPVKEDDSGSGGEDSNDEPDALSENEGRKTP